MTTEPLSERPALVACSTCDVAYVVHAGRRNCSVCGGEPGSLLMVLAEEEPSGESAQSAGEEAENPPAERPEGSSPDSTSPRADVPPGPDDGPAPQPASASPAEASASSRGEATEASADDGDDSPADREPAAAVDGGAGADAAE